MNSTFQLNDYRLYEQKVIRDVIHGYIRIEWRPIWQLINAKEMQRLRRIKQLGGTYMVFPSAEHSRFVHSLGVYEIVRNMLQLEVLEKAICDYDKLTVLCAALLHDVGHGPFSHSFEAVMNTSHEEMTVRIIKEDSEVHDILVAVDPNLPEAVANVIEKKHPCQMLVQMVSSQLDGDRMDYLLRDSYSAGVTYGQFDMSRILRTLRIYQGRIVFKESGVQAIEDYILARYHMYWQVYYHPTIRAYEHLLHACMKRIKDLYLEGYRFNTDLGYLEPILKGAFSVKEYLQLDESIMFYYFKRFMEEEDAILKDLTSRFMNRHLYKYCPLKKSEDLSKIQEISLHAGYDPRYYVTSDLTKSVPYHHYAIGDASGEIEILGEKLYSLPEKSEIVQAILKAKEKEDQKVFFVKEIKDLIRGIYEKEDLL